MAIIRVNKAASPSLCFQIYALRVHTVTDFSIGIQHFVQIMVGYLGLLCAVKFFASQDPLEVMMVSE